MTLMPTYITIDERMRLGYCTPLVEVGPGIWHHLLFGDVVETVYDPRWWFLRPGFGGGLTRRPGGGAIGGYFAPGDGPPPEMNCLGDPAIVSGPIYYDDYEPVGWWGRWFGGGRRRRRRWPRRPPHHGPHGPHLGPPLRRGPTSHLGPPMRRGPHRGSNAPPSNAPPSNTNNLKSGVMYPSSTPTGPSSMSLLTHPNAARAASIRREVEAWLQPSRAAPYREPMHLQAKPSYSTAAPYRAPMRLQAVPSYSTAAPYRRQEQVQYKPTYSTAAPMRRSVSVQYAGGRPTMRAMPMRSSGGGFRPAPLTHGLRGLGALLMRALGR